MRHPYPYLVAGGGWVEFNVTDYLPRRMEAGISD